MVKKLSLSILLFISGCGFYPVDSGYIDPVFIPYVEEYKGDKLLYLNTSNIVKVSIIFKTLDTGLAGMCEMTGFIDRITNKNKIFYRHIFIDPNHWYTLNELDQKLLIYHELGHCDLDLDHTDDYTIMNPYNLNGNTFILQPSYYLDLLFYQGK